MADKGKESSDTSGGWWGSLIAAAKQQTEKVYEMVGSDLAEFTSTMQSDTKKVVEKTKETLQQNIEVGENKNATDVMKQSFHSLMSGITKALTIDPEDTSPKQQVSHPTTGLFDRATARLRAIQVDTGTYLQEPSGPEEQYADWLKSFDLEQHKGDISELLVSMVEVRSLYTSLVPSEVSHQDFWRRYFYKVHQLQIDEARKQALMKRAERADTHEDSIGWDEEDEWSGDENDGIPGKKSSPESVKREDPSGRLQATASDSKTVTENTTEPKTDNDLTKSVLASTEPKVVIRDENNDNEIKHSTGPKEKIKPTGDSVQMNNKLDTVTTDNAVKHDKVDKINQVNQDDGADSVKDKSNQEKETNDIKSDIGVKNSLEIALETKVPDANSQAESIVQTKDKNVEVETKVETDAANKDDDGIKEAVVSAACDSQEEADDSMEKELKTKVKGDMVLVGDRVSPSSESSGTKESDEWEQDFDVEITADDLAAASQLAQKMNMSASEYNQLTGGEDEDDWENWE